MINEAGTERSVNFEESVFFFHKSCPRTLKFLSILTETILFIDFDYTSSLSSSLSLRPAENLKLHWAMLGAAILLPIIIILFYFTFFLRNPLRWVFFIFF